MRRNRTKTPERTERRISAFTSLSMCAFTVIAQIAVTLLLTKFLREKVGYFYAILEFAGAVAAIRVYLRSGSPSYKLVWMCLLLALRHPPGQEPESEEDRAHPGAGERLDGQ